MIDISTIPRWSRIHPNNATLWLRFKGSVGWPQRTARRLPPVRIKARRHQTLGAWLASRRLPPSPSRRMR